MAELAEVREDALMPSTNRSESPGKRLASNDPDEELEQLLRKQRTQDLQAVPAWAETIISMQHNMSLQLSDMGKGFHGFDGRIRQLEAENVGERMKTMEGQVKELVEAVSSMRRQSASQRFADPGGEASGHLGEPSRPVHPPPLPGSENYQRTSPKSSMTPSSPTGSSETDFNHIVAGGWPEDTRRKVIDNDTWQICEQFGPNVKINRVVVYGSRANTSHIYLCPLAEQEARERFYSLQQEHSGKFQSNVGGKPIWLSPSRTPERRAKNRSTRETLSRLQAVLQSDNPDELEVEWARQLIWYKDRRIATAKLGDIRSSSEDRVVRIHIPASNDSQEAGQFYVNVTLLAALTGKTASDIEVRVQTSS